MADLVTLAVAKQHLRIVDDDHDADVQQKLTAASAIIVKYLKAQADPTWTDATVPAPVQHAVLLMLAHLYENRGDDEAFGMSSRSGALWDAINRLLIGWRDPALA